MKRTIRITETQLKGIVKKVLREEIEFGKPQREPEELDKILKTLVWGTVINHQRQEISMSHMDGRSFKFRHLTIPASEIVNMDLDDYNIDRALVLLPLFYEYYFVDFLRDEYGIEDEDEVGILWDKWREKILNKIDSRRI